MKCFFKKRLLGPTQLEKKGLENVKYLGFKKN